MTTRPARLCLALLALVALAGCGPKFVRERVYDKPNMRVELRHQKSGDAPVARGYSHPVTIADVRIAHILASLSYEDDEGNRKPAIRSQFVYELGDAISAALAKAGPDDEVAAAVFPEDRRLQIFTDTRVTAFRLFVQGEQMRVEFYALEQALEPDARRAGPREYEIPTALPTLEPRFKLSVGQAQRKLGPRGIEVAWRDAYFRRPVSLSFRQGEARRRTVLMELPPEADPAASPDAPLPGNLSDAQLRALDELDSSRRSGLITESEYQRRRKLVLENALDEAGYGSQPR